MLTFRLHIFSVATSPNGWIDDHLCLNWFKKVFIPCATERNTSGKPIILIYDGHHSHTAHAIRQLAHQHGIILFCLPPHTTHRLQPLDVAIFGPLAKLYNRLVTAKTNLGQRVTKYNVIEVYMEARDSAFKDETIISAFRTTGIHPFNANLFEDHEFAPSHATSTSAHLPNG